MTSARTAWRVAGAALAALGLLALRWASIAEVPTANGERAAIRLSWSARPERIEQCRRLTDDELAARPAHMRLRYECTGVFARYLLVVERDGQPIAADTIRGGGLRHDRPMHLFQEILAEPGGQRVTVSLTRLDSASAVDTSSTATAPGDTLLGARELRELDERRRRAGEAIPPVLLLDTALTLHPRQVLLVTYDGQARRLVARTDDR